MTPQQIEALLEKLLGQTCPRCGVAIDTYADKCPAAPDDPVNDPCPAREIYERARREVMGVKA